MGRGGGGTSVGITDLPPFRVPPHFAPIEGVLPTAVANPSPPVADCPAADRRERLTRPQLPLPMLKEEGGRSAQLLNPDPYRCMLGSGDESGGGPCITQKHRGHDHAGPCTLTLIRTGYWDQAEGGVFLSFPSRLGNCVFFCVSNRDFSECQELP